MRDIVDAIKKIVKNIDLLKLNETSILNEVNTELKQGRI